MMHHKRTRDGLQKAPAATDTPFKASQPSRAADDDTESTPTPPDVFDEPTPTPSRNSMIQGPANEVIETPVISQAGAVHAADAGLCTVPAPMLARIAGAGGDAAAALKALSKHLHTMADATVDVKPVLDAATVASTFLRNLMGPAVRTAAAAIDAREAAAQAGAAMTAAWRMCTRCTPSDVAAALAHLPPGTPASIVTAVCFEFLTWTQDLRGIPRAGRWRADRLLDLHVVHAYMRVAGLDEATEMPIECATNLQVDDCGAVCVTSRAMLGVQAVDADDQVILGLDDGKMRMHLLVFLVNVTRVLGMRTRDDVLTFVRALTPGTRLLTSAEEDVLMTDGQFPAASPDAAHVAMLDDAATFRTQRLF